MAPNKRIFCDMRATSVLLELSSSNSRRIGVDETVLNDSREECFLYDPLRRNLPAAIPTRALAEVMDCYSPQLNSGQNAKAIPSKTLCLISSTS